MFEEYKYYNKKMHFCFLNLKTMPKYVKSRQFML